MTLFLTAVIHHDLSYQIIITSNLLNLQYIPEQIITLPVIVGYFRMVSVATMPPMMVLSVTKIK